MDASDLTALSSDLPAVVRYRCGTKSTDRKRREMTTLVLEEIGLGEIKIGRALYTLRRRLAAQARLDAIALKAIK